MHYLIRGFICEFSFGIQPVISEIILGSFGLQQNQKILLFFQKNQFTLVSGRMAQAAQAPACCKKVNVSKLHEFDQDIIWAMQGWSWLAKKAQKSFKTPRVQKEQSYIEVCAQ